MKALLNRNLAIYLLMTLILAVLHFKNGLERTFIDYDDLDVVRRMLKLDFVTYFQDWLPDRRHYAFPIRDLSLFVDHWLSGDGISLFWISNFLYFAISALFFSLTLQRLMPRSKLLYIVLLSIFMFHPFQTEVLEWITCRKYLTGGVPIAIGTYLVVRWRETVLTYQKKAILIGLWLISLLSYPTAVFWVFWAFYYINRRSNFKNHLRLFASLAAASFLYLWIVGRNTGEINSSLVNIIPAFGKSFHYAYNALGRGFFNLALPFWTFPYYREDSAFTFLGLILLLVSCIAFYRYVYLKSKKDFKKSKKEQTKPVSDEIQGTLKECFLWTCGGLLFFIPTANTILGFFDFMLADRHFYFSLPFFIIALGYLLQAIHQLVKPTSMLPQTIIFVILVSWLLASAFSIFTKAPLWHDDFLLMKDCALNEKSPRCYSQTIRRRFFKSDCNGVKDIISLAANAYKNRPPYSFEYSSEVPFFHGSCIALNLSIPKEKKAVFIDSLQEFYGPSPEIIFGLVLAKLEMGQLDQAFNDANQYYLSGLPNGPISATRTLQSIYLGQISALCSLKPSPLCKERMERFQSVHLEAELNNGAGSWGKEATLAMAKRGSLIP
ncbi:MAG: hypothetical protein WCI18_07785 [Pseudomonadota bacterium]